MNSDEIHGLSLLLLLYLGMLGLNLAMDKHAKAVLKQALSPLQAKISQLTGWGFIVLGFVLAMRIWGGAVGLCVAFGALTVVLGLLIFLQSYRPRWSWYLGCLALPWVCILQVFV